MLECSSTNLEVHPSFVVSFVAEQSVVVRLCRQEPYAVDLVRQHLVLVLEVQLVHSTNWLAFLYQQHGRFPVLVLSQELELSEDLLLVEVVCKGRDENIKLRSQLRLLSELLTLPRSATQCSRLKQSKATFITDRLIKLTT